jgi:hypothetical protein
MLAVPAAVLVRRPSTYCRRQCAGDWRPSVGAGGAFDPGRDVSIVFQQALLLKWRRILNHVLLPA